MDVIAYHNIIFDNEDRREILALRVLNRLDMRPKTPNLCILGIYLVH